jgi:iron complex transport system ATP-binding protein
MELNQITYAYDKKSDILKKISADIEMSQITTVIGPNGSGKSTLLGVMARNFSPKSGHVILDGKNITDFKPKELARKIAVVHQQNEAPSDMTVEKLTSYGRLPHRSMWTQSGTEDELAIEWALKCTKLIEKRHMRLDQLSGGERQRVWIALALAQKTPFLFLDEPTTYLDMYYQIEVLDLIKSLNVEYGLTIVMVLHDVNQAVRYSDSIIVMKDGEVHMAGAPERVITEQTMKDIYGVKVTIKQEEETGMIVVPLGIV